jgi:hypothetical protein
VPAAIAISALCVRIPRCVYARAQGHRGHNYSQRFKATACDEVLLSAPVHTVLPVKAPNFANADGAILSVVSPTQGADCVVLGSGLATPLSAVDDEAHSLDDDLDL